MEHLAHTDPHNDNHARNGARLVSTDGSLVPLRATHLESRAEGGVARTILTQTFINEGASAIRVRYLVPLPADGAVSGFSFTIGEKRIVGEIDRKASARERFEVPLWAYQVSGEFSMLCAAIERGWLDRERVIAESLLSIRRAGAEKIISYFAKDVARGVIG